MYEIEYIFSYKYFEYERSSFPQKYFSNIEDCEIELYWFILIDPSHTGCWWCYIRCNCIELPDSETFQIAFYLFELKYTFLEKMNIRETKIRIYFLYIYPDGFSLLSYYLCYNLKKTSRCSSDIENIHLWFYYIVFFLYFYEFECTSCSITEFLGFFKVWIMDDKWLWHIFWQKGKIG